jgi:hypothetical protein
MGTMTESPDPRPDQEHFGEASLGEAQSENPPPDPEMIGDDDAGEGEGGVEQIGGDQDAGPSGTAEQADVDDERDQAEG